jgi:acyl-CoA synthetase (AMP-forming)/AMP-acid ligase II
MNFGEYLFENIRNTGKECLLSREGSLTYQDLLSRINGLSAYIISNIGTGNECLILSENNPFFVIAYLAVIRSGNTALLVETQISDIQLATIYQECRIKLSFVQKKFGTKTKGWENVHTEEILAELPPCETSTVNPVHDDDVAVVIFTSGSTGAKKGVMLTHKNLCANTSSIVQYLELTPEDRICVTLPFFYCYGASLLHTHMRAGGSILLSKNIFIGGVIRDINAFRCTGFAGVPSTYQILINKTPFLKDPLPTLRFMQQAGGQLPNKYIRMIAEAFPEKKFFVMYGATEATARLSFLPPDKVLKKLGSVGRGIPGVNLEVIDESGMPVRPGEIGEIVAAGDNIMKGYYGDPKGTAEVLSNGRLRTGDLATVDNEGYIFIHGRAKNIIKSGGYRISPNEIEDFICALDGITGCVVLGLPDETMGEAVIAVVQYDGTAPAPEVRKMIETRCRQQLPSYKVPRRLFFVREFQLNASDKVDKPALSISIQEEIRRDPWAGL